LIQLHFTEAAVQELVALIAAVTAVLELHRQLLAHL
jgi:hypothetical protein